jgi:hypothetical protein
MSETFVPVSVWEAAAGLEYGVFELIDASTIHDLMRDVFQQRVGLRHNYLLEPFNFRVQLSFRNSFDRYRDEYKYRVAVVNDKLRININPVSLTEVNRLREFMEGYSYN